MGVVAIYRPETLASGNAEPEEENGFRATSRSLKELYGLCPLRWEASRRQHGSVAIACYLGYSRLPPGGRGTYDYLPYC